jgi:hypothetical protein
MSQTNITHIWQEEIIESSELITVSTIIENPDKKQNRLWYKLPAKHREIITNNCDPFVIANILMAMSQSTNIVVHGIVSPSLLQNLAEFQAAWSSWRPNQYKLIEITAEIEQEEYFNQNNHNNQNIDNAIATFSGGVDSSFTMYHHSRKTCGRQQQNIKAGLMVHGFDIPLAEEEAFNSAAKKSKIMLSSLGIELIPMATNFREVIPINWEDTFATALASCMILLQKGYTKGLIPSSFPYNALAFPYGSNPITDALLSSKTFQIIHDGAAFTRLEKIKAISSWKEASQNLRICWEGKQKDSNCCRCEKCVRNILNYRILGIDLPECFEQDISDKQILHTKAKGAQLDALERTLKAAKSAGISATWVTALEKSVRRNHLRNSLINSLPVSIKQQLRQIKKRTYQP